MKTVAVLFAIACVALAKGTVTKSKIATSKGKVAVEWIQNTPQFRSRTSLATVEMVDSGATTYEGMGDAVQASAEEKALFKLKSAIIQIKGDIVRKVGDLRSEANWVSEVKVITTQFREKITKTKAAIQDKKILLKALLKKKRQLENLLLQLKLQAKLNEAKTDLGSLQTALRSVAEKKATFAINSQEVQKTVDEITSEIKLLNGGVMPTSGTQGTVNGNAIKNAMTAAAAGAADAAAGPALSAGVGGNAAP